MSVSAKRSVRHLGNVESDLAPMTNADKSSENKVPRCLQLARGVTIMKMVDKAMLVKEPKVVLKLNGSQQYQGVVVGIPLSLHQNGGRTTSVLDIYQIAYGVYWVVTRSCSAYLITGTPADRGS